MTNLGPPTAPGPHFSAARKPARSPGAQPLPCPAPVSEGAGSLGETRIAVPFPSSGLLLCGLMLASLLANHPAMADAVDDYMRTEMEERQIPGAALAIVQNGEVKKTAAYGLANIELQVPVKLETVFEIGSLTKQLTAAGILLLQQEGKLHVDDRISRYLKGVPESWQGITVRHLLTHTSGIKTYTGLDGFELRRHLTQAQFLETIGAQPLDFQPGDAWKYSNTGTACSGTSSRMSPARIIGIS